MMRELSSVHKQDVQNVLRLSWVSQFGCCAKLQSISEADVILQALWHEDNGQRPHIQERYGWALQKQRD